MRPAGLVGGSYGSETPVNSLISPRKAFSYRPLTSRRAHSSTDASTKTSTNVPFCSTISRAFRRASTYGEIAETITAAPCRVSREATQPMRSMFVSRSSFEKPRPLQRCSRTSSPSSHSTERPRRSSSGRTSSAIVVLPAPESPVNQRVKPLRSFSVIALLDEWGVDVNAAFELLGAGPPARSLALPRLHGPRARDAPDRRVPGVVKRVVRDLVDVDVGLDALRVPVDERLDLPDAVPLAPLDAARTGPRRRLLPADAGDPGVVAGERTLQRLDLPDLAAVLRRQLPWTVRRVDWPERRELEAVALDQPVARLVRLGEEHHRVDLDDVHVEPEFGDHVDEDGALPLPRAREAEPVAELLRRPPQHLLGRHGLEVQVR